MEIRKKFLLLIASSISVFFTIPAQSAAPCEAVSCRQSLGPTVRFPFRLIDRQGVRCGYPGFDLRCNRRGQTVLSLPDSIDFVVYNIDYSSAEIYIDDPLSCAILNLSLAGSPFRFYSTYGYALFDCSGPASDYFRTGIYMPVPCFVGKKVVAAILDVPAPPMCRWMGNVAVPSRWEREPADACLVRLMWREPAGCEECELRGEFCGYESDSGSEIGCYSLSSSSRSGLSLVIKFLIAVGVVILICVIAWVLYKISASRPCHDRNSQLSIVQISSEISTVIGLDQPSIESYPIMVLGESGRLPNPSNDTCPICLCDYKPKDAIRSIPKCNHYFHANCVDEWLSLNDTCPVCRSLPVSSSNG